MAAPLSGLIAEFEKQGNALTQAANNQEEVFSAEDWKNFTAAERDTILMKLPVGLSQGKLRQLV